MRFEILDPSPARVGDALDELQALAKQPWRWQVVDDDDRPMATSHELPSEEHCRREIERLGATFKHGDPQIVTVKAPRT